MRPGLFLLHYVCLLIMSRAYCQPSSSSWIRVSSSADRVLVYWSYPIRHRTFTIELSRLQGKEYQRLCPFLKDDRTNRKGSSSIIYRDLEAFSNYSVTVSAPQGKPISRTFVTPSTAPTGTPDILTHSATTRSATVLWSTISCTDLNGLPNGYEVDFRQVGTNETIMGEVIGETFMAHGLQPDTLYAFKVAVLNHYSKGPFSDGLRLRTLKEWIFVEPSLASMSASASVSWSYDSPKKGLYFVQLSRLRGSYQKNCPSLKDNRSYRTKKSSIFISDLEEYSNYTVSVSGLNSEIKPIFESFITPNRAPTGAPHILIHSPLSRSASLLWRTIDCTDLNGQFVGYEVDFRQLNGTESITGEVIGQTFMARGLKPGTLYTFKVAVRNAEGLGPFSAAFRFSTPAEAPGIVSNFSVQLIYTTIAMSWGLPEEPNGKIIGYDIIYTVKGRRPTWRNVKTTFFNTPPLGINTIISNISVWAYTRAGPGPLATHPAIIIIPAIIQPLVPPNVSVMHIPMTTSVRVEWDKIPPVGLGGYTVYYSSETESEQSITVPSSQNSILIMDLNDDTEYQLQVVAIGTDNRQKLFRELLNPIKIFVPSPSCKECIAVAAYVGGAAPFVTIIIVAIALSVWSCYANNTLCPTARIKKEHVLEMEVIDDNEFNVEDPIHQPVPYQDSSLLSVHPA